MQNTRFQPIGGPLRRRVNQWAHQQAQAHEARLRAQIFERLEQAQASGAKYNDMQAMLDSLMVEVQA